MLKKISYDRNKALDYAQRWALKRNPHYMDFHGIGGDCTNFISQCIYAGCGVMNYTKTMGWYYNSANDRAPAWTGVQYLYNFLTTNQGVGPYGIDTDISQIKPGDIIQLGDQNLHFYHSLFIQETGLSPSPHTIRIATHSDDAQMRALDTYFYYNIRFIHLLGARKY